MPAAIPLVAVVASGVVSSAVGGGVFGALAGAGAAFLVTHAGGKAFPAKKAKASAAATAAFDAAAPGAGRTQSFRQPVAEHQIVFGRCKVSGPIVFLHSAPDDAGRADGFFHEVVVLAAHSVRGIGEVFLGDKPQTDPLFAGLVRDIDASVVDIRLVSGFTNGIRSLGDGRGVEDSTFHLGRILNCKVGLDIRCLTASAWNTSVRYYGGHFAVATGINPTLDRFGVRFGAEPGAYSNHNRHVFDAPNFELRQLDPNVAIPFLNETSGSAIIGRALRMEACSPIVARHTAGAQDCEYEVAWANTYRVGIQYTATATRCGNAVLNRHRAPASRHLRLLGAVPNLRAAAFRQSATEVGVEGLATIATSTTTQTTLAGLSFNGLDGIAATSRGLLCDAQKGFAFVVDCTQAKEFALAHWLVNGADGGRLFVRCFGGDGTVREYVAGDVLASLTTMVWNVPSKSWTGGATMADASLNRRMTVRLGDAVAFAQIGIVGLDGQIELEALRLYGLPEAAPALLCGTPTLPVGRREFAVETLLDLPNLAAGATQVDTSKNPLAESAAA